MGFSLMVIGLWFEVFFSHEFCLFNVHFSSNSSCGAKMLRRLSDFACMSGCQLDSRSISSA